MKFIKLNDLAKTPTKGSENAAGADLYAATSYNIEIQPHQTVKIGTGIAIELPQYTLGAIFARSGIATKQGLRPANAVGVVDPDYRGEIIVALHNDSEEVQTVIPGERIAQLVVLSFIDVDFNEVNELSDTERADGGFGSTGVK